MIAVEPGSPEVPPEMAPGAVLLWHDRRLPETLLLQTRPFSTHWSLLKDQSRWPLLKESLWRTSHRKAAPLRRAATGTDKQQMIQAALERLLAGAGLQSFNCLEIDEIKMHSLLTIRYASVSGHAHHLHAGNESAG